MCYCYFAQLLVRINRQLRDETATVAVVSCGLFYRAREYTRKTNNTSWSVLVTFSPFRTFV